jgi:hypothetical protein
VLATSAVEAFEQKGDVTGTAWARMRLHDLGLAGV